MAAAPKLEDCVNTHCPWSGKPVGADSLARYKGKVVGFCNPGCRDKFLANPESHPEALTHFGLRRAAR